MAGAPDGLCALAEKFIAQYVEDNTRLGTLIKEMDEYAGRQQSRRGIGPEETYFYQFSRDNYHAINVSEAILLFAIGVQLAANACGEHGKDTKAVVSCGAAENSGTAYHNAATNEIGLTVTGISEYICSKNAAIITNNYLRSMASSRSETYIQDVISAGAEEYYHTVQRNDPKKWRQLQSELVEKYGSEWDKGKRADALLLARQFHNEEGFRRHDPLEKDAHAFREAQMSKIIEAAEKFRQSHKSAKLK